MKKRYAKVALIVILTVFTFGVVVIYGMLTSPVALWICLWLLTFMVLLFWTGGLHERGAFFSIASIVIAIGGQRLLEETYGKILVLELLSQVFLVVGASIGANLISDWLVKVERSGQR